MKKFLFLIIGVLLAGTISAQQRYAFVDTEYILKNISEYQIAKDKLNELSKAYQEEIEGLYKDAMELDEKYRSDKIFLSTEMREKKEKEIAEKQYTARQLQEKYFGRNGELYKKRQELVKPIQENIYDAIKELARTGDYSMILDQASAPIVLFANPKYDVSDKILEMLGYK